MVINKAKRDYSYLISILPAYARSIAAPMLKSDKCNDALSLLFLLKYYCVSAYLIRRADAMNIKRYVWQ